MVGTAGRRVLAAFFSAVWLPLSARAWPGPACGTRNRGNGPIGSTRELQCTKRSGKHPWALGTYTNKCDEMRASGSLQLVLAGHTGTGGTLLGTAEQQDRTTEVSL